MCYTACTFGAKTQAECLRFCYGDEESEHRAGTNGHLTTANHTGMYIPGIVRQYHNARGWTKIANGYVENSLTAIP